MLVKLTSRDGDPMLMKTRKIQYILPRAAGGSSLHYKTERLYCRETPQEIRESHQEQVRRTGAVQSHNGRRGKDHAAV